MDGDDESDRAELGRLLFVAIFDGDDRCVNLLPTMIADSWFLHFRFFTLKLPPPKKETK